MVETHEKTLTVDPYEERPYVWSEYEVKAVGFERASSLPLDIY
jgi:hypothetical protein